MTRPKLMLYCQHYLGMGHWVRSIALAEVLKSDFDVVFLNGNHPPPGADLPDGIEFVHLPALTLDEHFQLQTVNLDDRLDDVKAERQAILDGLAARHCPDILLIELYPFGRKKFGFELDPLIKAVRSQDGLVICSVRDILVSDRKDQDAHDLRAAHKLNRDFDCVIIHSDPRLAKLEETFQPAQPLTIPVFYSGYVVPTRPVSKRPHRNGIVVSAGGGIVGFDLFRTALMAHAELHAQTGWPITIVAGPFLPDPDWTALLDLKKSVPGVTLMRSVPNLLTLIQSAAVSVSQCGYNTALDLIISQTPAVMVPYASARETEQSVRAQRLCENGLGVVLAEKDLSPASLRDAVLTASRQAGTPIDCNVDGAAGTLNLLRGRLLRRRTQGAVA